MYLFLEVNGILHQTHYIGTKNDTSKHFSPRKSIFNVVNRLLVMCMHRETSLEILEKDCLFRSNLNSDYLHTYQ